MATAILKVAPRSQEERSANTQLKLAKAAYDLIRRSGFANFRVASVAKEAGVSQGGQLHHFPTKDDLTLAAIDYAVEQARQAFTRNIESVQEGDDLIAAIIKDARDYYFSPSFDVAMDITRSSASNPELRRRIARVHRRFRGDVESAWQSKLVARGLTERDAVDCIALTTSIVRGFAIRAMLGPNTKELDRLMARWCEFVRNDFPGIG